MKVKIIIFILLLIGLYSLVFGQDWIRTEINFTETITDRIIEDLNKDGLIDILILSGRYIYIYIQTENGFNKIPNNRIYFKELGEVIDIGEVNPKYPGLEILGLSERGIKYYYLEDHHYKEYSDFLISQKTEKSFYNWGPLLSDFAFDINNDGLDEIVFFHDNQFYQYYLDNSVEILKTKINPTYKIKNISLNSRLWTSETFLSENSKQGYFFRPEIKAKNIVFFQDVDEDGSLDLISEDINSFINFQKSKLPLEQNHQEIMQIPFLKEKEQEVFLDINKDGKLDRVLIEINDVLSNDLNYFPYAKYFIFLNNNNTFKSKPDYFFKTIIIDGNIPFIDIDSDGNLDFISIWSNILLGSKEDILQLLTKYNIEFTLRCYRFLNGKRFSKSPDISMTFKIEYKNLSDIGSYMPFNFSDDFNFDGNNDLSIRKNPERILVYLMDFKQQKPKIKKVVQIKIPKYVNKFKLIDFNNDRKTDILLLAEKKIILLLSE